MKKLTLNNWLKPDKLSMCFVGNDTSRKWLNSVLEPQLMDSVPEEIKDLFEVARGALVYAYLFYPLHALASEQFYRVNEAAVITKCKQFGCPKTKKSFRDKVDWLITKGIIHPDKRVVWDAIRKLRNSSSHPKSQGLLTPGNALSILDRTVEEINSLFKVDSNIINHPRCNNSQ